MRRYEPRPIRFHGIRDVDGWRLKLYSIAYDKAPVDWTAFEPALARAESTLPRPAVAPGRVGVGFAIAHQGRTALYLVLGWWDNENELPLHVFVRPLEGSDAWRPARGPESVCVWDLQVISFERDVYVATILSGDGDPTATANAYIATALEREPAEPRLTSAAVTSGTR
jgi:hypothetical protein